MKNNGQNNQDQNPLPVETIEFKGKFKQHNTEPEYDKSKFKFDFKHHPKIPEGVELVQFKTRQVRVGGAVPDDDGKNLSEVKNTFDQNRSVKVGTLNYRVKSRSNKKKVLNFKTLNQRNQKFQVKKVENEVQKIPQKIGQVQQSLIDNKGQELVLTEVVIGQGGDEQDKLPQEDRIEWKDENKLYQNQDSNNPELKRGGADQKIHKNRGAPGSNIIEMEPPKEMVNIEIIGAEPQNNQPVCVKTIDKDGNAKWDSPNQNKCERKLDEELKLEGVILIEESPICVMTVDMKGNSTYQMTNPKDMKPVLAEPNPVPLNLTGEIKAKEQPICVMTVDMKGNASWGMTNKIEENKVQEETVPNFEQKKNAKLNLKPEEIKPSNPMTQSNIEFYVSSVKRRNTLEDEKISSNQQNFQNIKLIKNIQTEGNKRKLFLRKDPQKSIFKQEYIRNRNSFKTKREIEENNDDLLNSYSNNLLLRESSKNFKVFRLNEDLFKPKALIRKEFTEQKFAYSTVKRIKSNKSYIRSSFKY